MYSSLFSSQRIAKRSISATFSWIELPNSKGSSRTLCVCKGVVMTGVSHSKDSTIAKPLVSTDVVEVSVVVVVRLVETEVSEVDVVV